MKDKAIVMEIRGTDMILLTKDGQFISRPVTHDYPQIGDEITVNPMNIKKSPWVTVGLLTMAAVLLLTFFIANITEKNAIVTPTLGSVVNFVTIDINPSVELGLDSDDRVVSIEALNDDGKVILQDVNIIGKSSETALEIIINAAAENGYLDRGKQNNILISITSKDHDDEKVAKLMDKLPTKANSTIEKKKLEVKVNSLKTDLESKQLARELDISVGKYAILMKAQEAGLDISPKEIKELGIAKAIKSAGGDPRIIMSKANEKKEFREKIKIGKGKIEKDSSLSSDKDKDYYEVNEKENEKRKNIKESENNEVKRKEKIEEKIKKNKEIKEKRKEFQKKESDKQRNKLKENMMKNDKDSKVKRKEKIVEKIKEKIVEKIKEIKEIKEKRKEFQRKEKSDKQRNKLKENMMKNDKDSEEEMKEKKEK